MENIFNIKGRIVEIIPDVKQPSKYLSNDNKKLVKRVKKIKAKGIDETIWRGTLYFAVSRSQNAPEKIL